MEDEIDAKIEQIMMLVQEIYRELDPDEYVKFLSQTILEMQEELSAVSES